MSARQDKATTERHARTLREMLKNPENKVCADCKRNDPRWASWNLGVYLCIRCSGIHRSMGTHISKVKSVDLDVWTLEQMNSIQKWGNRRANAYWEAHLKAGHIPPDHKMDSFIRSKYESRRWAMDGPPPSDPSVLDDAASQEAEAPAPAPAPIAAPISTSRASHASTGSTSSIRSPVTTRQPQPHQLLSTAVAGRAVQAAFQPAAPQPPQQQQQAPAAPAPSAANDLFSLDFHNPTPQASAPAAAPKKDVKQDILSLFSTPAAAAPPQAAFGQFGAAQAQAQNAWGQFAAAPVAAAPAQPTSMMGTAGAGMWGASSGWAGQPVAAQPNVWASNGPAVQQPQMTQQSLFSTNDIWASSAASSNGGSGDLFGTTSLPTKKDDVFGDIWGGFK